MEERMKKVIIIDALNLFIRNYVVNPTMSSKGLPLGGCIGFLKSLQKICRILNPDEVIVCWDGIGGSARKKAIDKDYKAGRKPLRFNRRMIKLDPELQEQNKVYQQIRLYEYLNEMPIIQVAIDAIEADDIIGYIVGQRYYDGWEKVIVSSDKDFFQLASPEIKVYRPIQNKFITVNSLLEADRVHPNNYALARAIVGDKSDNLPGIKGIGMKTVAKSFPLLMEERQVDVDELIELSSNQETTVQKKIYANAGLIDKNYDMMQLYSPKISLTNKQSIDYQIQNFEFSFAKLNVTKMLYEDGQASLNFSQLFSLFKRFTVQNTPMEIQ